MTKLPGIILCLLIAFILWICLAHGSVVFALSSLLLLTALCYSGRVISDRIFSQEAERLIFAFPIGYAMHAVLLSLLGRFLGIGPLVFLIYATAALIASWLFRPKNHDVREGRLFPQERLVLVLWLLLTVLMVAFPLIRVGVETSAGFAYRAYFNADFFRNMAVSGSLAHTGVPPVNPYFGGRTLHYYWFFHVLPASWDSLFSSWRLDLIFVQFSLAAILMFVSCLYATLRRLVSSSRAMNLTFLLFALGGSYKGIYILHRLSQKGEPWQNFTTLNVDGILRWDWNAPQIDTLYRALLYAPQHLIPLCIFLVAFCFCLGLFEKKNRNSFAVLILSALVFSTLGFSVFVGGILIAAAGVILLFRFVRKPKAWTEIVGFAVLGLLFAILYGPVFHMFEPVSTVIKFGLDPVIRQHWPAYILLNWGALVLFGVCGIFLHPAKTAFRVLTVFLILCVFFIFFVELDLPGLSDISLKMGHFSHVVLLLLAAGFFDWVLGGGTRRTGTWLIACVILAVVPASISWWMDAYNCRDISNAKFTTTIPREDAALYIWMKRSLPSDVLVQNYSLDYAGLVRDFVSEAPPLAERPVFLGDRIFSRIFQISEADVDTRKRIMQQLFRERAPERIHLLAQQNSIAYFYIRNQDSARQADILSRLSPPYFSVLFQSGNSLLVRVNP